MTWALFESHATDYESWYATGPGACADEAEQRPLEWLLAAFPSAPSALEAGSGTGHFTRWLAGRLVRVVGAERSPAMLHETRRLGKRLPAVQADAAGLPFRDRSLDLVLFVTALEFVDAPARALLEAAPVARQGLVLVVLNRWSVGGFSRRWGPQSRRPLLGQAHDCTVPELRQAVRQASGARLARIEWRSTLFPGPWWNWQARAPVGGVLGLRALLDP